MSKRYSSNKKPKKKTYPKISLGSIEIENLPLPVVYYPGHYGTFFCFSREKYDHESLSVCSCSEQPIINIFRLFDLEKPDKHFLNDPGAYFPSIIVSRLRNWDGNLKFPIMIQDRLCHKCNNMTPTLRYCHEIYGTRFMQYYGWYGWYVNQTYLRLGIFYKYSPEKISYLSDVCPKEFQNDIDEINILREMLPNNFQAFRDYLSLYIDFEKLDPETIFWRNVRRENLDSINNLPSIITKRERVFSNKIENITRAEFGFKNVGEGWINETVLFQIIESLFPNDEVIFHSKPSWLNGLEIDVFVPERKIGFEYQGKQHYYPIPVWGGNEAFEKLKERDALKLDLCKANGVRLIIIDYTEALSEETVIKRINSS